MLVTEDDGSVALRVCVDCIVIIANGTDTEEQVRVAELMAERWKGFNLVPACPEECDGGFSWSACDGCGSELGGDRHDAVAFPV